MFNKQPQTLSSAYADRSNVPSSNGAFVWFGRSISIIGIAIILAALVLGLYTVSLLLAAVLCGMAESRGRCGVSHIGMLAPFKKMDSVTWAMCCSAYTFGGIVTAYLIGLLIAGVGSWFHLGVSRYYLGR